MTTMSDDQLAILHRDLSVIKELLARLDERLATAQSGADRRDRQISANAAKIDSLQSRLDRAEGAVSVWRWVAGAGAGAGGGSLLMEIIQLASRGG